MGKINDMIKLFNYYRHKFYLFVLRHLFYWLPDTTYLKLLYRFKMGHRLNLRNPKTFTEKLQWLKLYNRKPEYTKMVDKYAVKDYVSGVIGPEYIIPTIGVWNKPEEIDWDSLPNQFVLKTTHGGGSGGVVICKDKETFNKEEAIRKLITSMKSDIYKSFREWPYKNVPKRIIAEKYIASESKTVSKDLPDYKFFCFDGEPKYCQVIRDRHTMETIDFYDMDWNHQDFIGLNPVELDGILSVPCNGLLPVPRPECFEKMKELCRKLAKGIPFLRVDLYDINGSVFFGELTFYPAAGIGTFTPEEWTIKLGDMLTLPVTDRKYM